MNLYLKIVVYIVIRFYYEGEVVGVLFLKFEIVE